MKLIADVSGALYRPDKHMLIVADLHFEKASALPRGVALPPYDTAATLQRLAAAFDQFNREPLSHWVMRFTMMIGQAV